jgi:hypothetical protein
MKKNIWIIEKKEKNGYFPLLYFFGHVIDRGPEFIFKALQVNFKTKEDAEKALRSYPKEYKYRARKYTTEGK